MDHILYFFICGRHGFNSYISLFFWKLQLLFLFKYLLCISSLIICCQKWANAIKTVQNTQIFLNNFEVRLILSLQNFFCILFTFVYLIARNCKIKCHKFGGVELATLKNSKKIWQVCYSSFTFFELLRSSFSILKYMICQFLA